MATHPVSRQILSPFKRIAVLCAATSALCAAQTSVNAQVIPETPLITSQVSVPMTMLTVGRDHTLFYEAYNDASDLDGDGILDVRFKPNITYYGLFDSDLCYTHSGGRATTDLFSPDSAAGELGKCPGKWSGNWLNYVTTSRIDALRKVFYGGMREVDTSTQTVLRRAYIPQDAHSWAKEYTSLAVDGYLISDYTPLSQPSGSGTRRHFFGSLTATDGVDCSTLSDCSDRAPLLRVITNSQNTRVWQWASSERPVLAASSNHNGTRADYTVRVEVCTASFNAGCKRYPNGNYKPTGLLHEYGENEAMYFGLLTGSYNKNMSGGVLRKVVSSFRSEVNQSTGVFTDNATIVKTLNSLRIRDFNNGRTDNSYRGGWVTTRAMQEGEFVDWGNPIGEMMYETLRYFAGKKSATSAYATSGSHDQHIGLPVATWDDPYETGSAASAHWCARPNMLVVSGINPSFDSDQLPGSAFGSFSGDLSGLSVSQIAATITGYEGDIAGLRYIGQSEDVYDGAPTAKDVTSLGTIRGLAPEEPTKQGSYYSAAVAYFGKSTDLRPDLSGRQTVDTYAVVLSSPLPKIEVPLGGTTITLVPFAKSVGGSSISNAKGNFQPTNQIVDFYVDTIANSSAEDADASVNDGRYYARFRVNFEDVEQGADHDMDAIVVYEIAVEADGRLRVRLTPEYEEGGIKHSMGYVISGTTKDGVYLVVQDEHNDQYYYLNVPPDMDPGACDVTSPPAACSRLPCVRKQSGHGSYDVCVGDRAYSERFFGPGSSSASLLKDPLWYAAKWGGFVDRNNNSRPDQLVEWDSDGDGVPDTYFLVQNPLGLYDALRASFESIISRTTSISNIAANGQELRSDSRIFRARFSDSWNGELTAYTVDASGVVETPLWHASEQLPAANSRTIYTRNSAGDGAVQFLWSGLSTAQQNVLGSESVLNYLRGDTSQEIRNGGALRSRLPLLAGSGRPLGDMVHSSPYYVADSNTVYIGANDGMLHAFDAETGVEHFAYIPSHIFSKLPRLADPEYVHTWFVDGEIAVSPKRTWSGDRNILVGSTGRGARGLFALDVTDPDDFDEDDVLWEYSGAADNDLGFVLGVPQIAQLENGNAVVIVGNGNNSPNAGAVLYVFDLSSGALLKKLDTGVNGSNGLSAPTLVDRNLNGRIDTVYAGDELGNVWRFDLSGSVDSWRSHYRNSGGSPLPLFTARDPDGAAQPISAQLTTALNTVPGSTHYGKRFVLFGTGRYIYASDPVSTQVQSWYGLIDDGTNRIGNHRTENNILVERTWADSSLTVDGKAARLLASATAGDMVNRKGWFLDFDVTSGERITSRSVLYFLQEATLLASSLVPSADPCVAGGSGYLNAINPFTGGRLVYPPFDLGGDFSSVDFGIGIPSTPIMVGGRIVVGGSGGTGGDSGGGETPPCEGEDCEPPCEGEDCPEPEVPDCNEYPDLAACKAQITLPDTGRVFWRETVR
ncbi:pilus assembly protein [Pseudothauera nasutitermitis]|uniref:Pilus assembly protein n=1 Tax=Pseudothauera nasutitermitis TaxID=2565930 RepID=A0A4S4B0B4_9RHOO|nr:PilC/PilY family type IV pilus protein [Pseudothauera nasutitermitis]THF65891.1 pilus assembly protein [Pseudothauera nasutitermitis]